MMHDLKNKLGQLDGIDLNDLMERLRNLENEMAGKLDKIDFQNEIASIRSMIGNIDYNPKQA